MADLAVSLFSDVPHYSMQVEIETVHTLRMQWNASDGFWYVRVLDETETIFYTEGRRVLPIGPWLRPEVQVNILQLKKLYDLSRGRFPGFLFALSSRPLRRVMEDADDITIRYASPETFAEMGA